MKSDDQTMARLDALCTWMRERNANYAQVSQDGSITLGLAPSLPEPPVVTAPEALTEEQHAAWLREQEEIAARDEEVWTYAAAEGMPAGWMPGKPLVRMK